MAVLDFTAFDYNDSASDLTIQSDQIDFDTMRRDADTYVFDDFGAGYFGDVIINFEVEITAIDNSGVAYVFALSNIQNADAGDLSSANDAIYIYISHVSPNMNVRLGDFNSDDNDTYLAAGTSLAHYYYTFERNGSTTTLDIYSDAERTSLVQGLSITCETGTKRYLYALLSRHDTGTPAPTITGYIKNLEIITGSESPSESASLSPSASESASQSPSESPSESPSATQSASESPSESPSQSPSASESPSESASLSPSASESASESPSSSGAPGTGGAKSKIIIIT